MITLADLCHSDTAVARGLVNEPDDAQRAALERGLATVIPQVEALVGSFKPSSGFRCLTLNTIVKGERDSRHMRGEAMDGRPLEMAIDDAFVRIAGSAIAYDQMILERKRNRDGSTSVWLHLGWSEPPRRQALRAELVDLEDGTTRKQYFTFTPRSRP
ncbi:MAG: D-Ala-D-Ala carboxypeptidase family metallohydrolase [Gemmatimonadaceae bacterium]|jgi:hypothetical protein